MKRSAFITTALLLLALPLSVSAESKTTVNVNSNTGSNTVCVNGKCTTSDGGTSTSKVCVNGVCHTNENGNVNYESPDGNTKVTINNNSTPAVVAQQNTNDSSETMEKTIDAEKVKPTIEQAVKAAREKADAKKEEVTKKIEETKKQFDIMSIINEKMQAVKEFFSFKFLFGEKN